MPEALPLDALARAARVAFGAAARVVAAEPLAGDASSRRYARLRLAGGAAPPTAIAMLLGADRVPLGSDEVGGGALGAELPFLNVGRWLATHGLPVPAIHAEAVDADGLLLLEDVGDATLWQTASDAPGDVPALFGAALDLLVALQVAGARRPPADCYAFRTRFDGALARWELGHFVDHGIETRRGSPLPAAERAAILAALDPVAAPFDDGRRVLCHRDFHAWNLHVQDGRLRLLDFQDALLGPEAYDVAALLADRTTSTLVSPGIERALLDRFVAGRAAAGLPVAADFPTAYRLCLLQRALKVIGRFWYLERVKGKPGYLAYLPTVYAVARRAFAALPALAGARALVVAHVPELAPEGA